MQPRRHIVLLLHLPAAGFFGYKCNIVDPCITSPCANGGTCYSMPNGDTPYSYCTNCNAGYIGSACEIVDHCYFDAPCRNGGSCTPTDSGFVCTCAAGYGGATCSDIVNACVTHPCQNNSTCTPASAGGNQTYQCTCKPGYTGANCESLLEGGPCAASPCVHGGTCNQVGNTTAFYCTNCDAGYIGAACEDRDPCVGAPCQNGAACVPTTTLGFQCLCAPGYTGGNCTDVIDNCASAPCENSGACTNIIGDGTYTCTCAAGYSGATCTDVIDNCASFPCQNGGSCTNVVGAGTYTCACVGSYLGPTCADVVDSCASAPCENGGTCTNVGGSTGSYTCTCAAGYTGANCTDVIDNCAALGTNPCQNGGSCVNVVGDGAYACACPDAYTGATCTDTVDCLLINSRYDVAARLAAGSCNACQQACWTTPGCAYYESAGQPASNVAYTSVCQASQTPICFHYNAAGDQLLAIATSPCGTCHSDCANSDGGVCAFWRRGNAGALPVSVGCDTCGLYSGSGDLSVRDYLQSSDTAYTCYQCHTLCLNNPSCTYYVTMPDAGGAVNARATNCGGGSCYGYDSNWNLLLDSAMGTCAGCQSVAASASLAYYRFGGLAAAVSVSICSGQTGNCNLLDSQQNQFVSLYTSSCASCASACTGSTCAYYKVAGSTLQALSRDWPACANCIVYDGYSSVTSATVEGSCTSCYNRFKSLPVGNSYFAFDQVTLKIDATPNTSSCSNVLAANCKWFDRNQNLITSYYTTQCFFCNVYCIENCQYMQWSTNPRVQVVAGYNSC